MGVGLGRTEKFRRRYQTDDSFRRRQIARIAERKLNRGRFDEYVRRVIAGQRGDAQMRERVGYGRAELLAHLRSLFTPDMSMDALLRGEIHIDHNEPVSWFDLADPAQLRHLWRLENVQPLWASDNCRKGARTLEQWLISA